MDTPNAETWLAEARASAEADLCGMFLLHNGVVRKTAKREAREGVEGLPEVAHLELTWEQSELDAAVEEARGYPGVHYVRAWVNRGILDVGDSMMYVLVGADIRPRCIDALERLVETIKSRIVTEREIYEQYDE